jgi:hypothetical protein
MLGRRTFLEPEPLKEIYKNGYKEPGARSFSEEAGAESRFKKLPAPQYCLK